MLAAAKKEIVPLAALPLNRNSHLGHRLPSALLYPTPSFVSHSSQLAYLHSCAIFASDLVVPPKTGNPPTTPWYTNPCIKGALLNGALHVGIDSLGLIPEAGGVAREIGHQFLYRGVVADQFGARVIKNVGFGAGLGSTILGLQDTSTTGLASTTLGTAGIVAAFARTAPIVGQVISGASIVVDLYSAGKEIAACGN